VKKFEVLANRLRRLAAMERPHDRIQRDSRTGNIVITVALLDVFPSA
jgi:hypothetical protein